MLGSMNIHNVAKLETYARGPLTATDGQTYYEVHIRATSDAGETFEVCAFTPRESKEATAQRVHVAIPRRADGDSAEPSRLALIGEPVCGTPGAVRPPCVHRYEHGECIHFGCSHAGGVR